jgi:hypothetical protein
MSKEAGEELSVHDKSEPEGIGHDSTHDPRQGSPDGAPDLGQTLQASEDTEDEQYPADYEPDYPDTVKELRELQQAGVWSF